MKLSAKGIKRYPEVRFIVVSSVLYRNTPYFVAVRYHMNANLMAVELTFQHITVVWVCHITFSYELAYHFGFASIDGNAEKLRDVMLCMQ